MGKFYLSEEQLKEISCSSSCYNIEKAKTDNYQELRLSKEIWQKFFGKFIITRAEYLHYTNTIEYYAYSELFDPCEMNTEIPLYEITIIILQENSMKICANKVKDKSLAIIKVIRLKEKLADSLL